MDNKTAILIFFLITASFAAIIVILFFVKKIMDEYVIKIIEAEKTKIKHSWEQAQETLKYMEKDIRILVADLNADGENKARYLQSEIDHVRDKWRANFERRDEQSKAWLNSMYEKTK